MNASSLQPPLARVQRRQTPSYQGGLDTPLPQSQQWHTPQTGQAWEPPCKRPSHSTTLRLTLGNCMLGPRENETKWYFLASQSRSAEREKSRHTTAPVRNSVALFVQVSDFIRLCHSVNIVYGPILCLWITHSQRLFPPPHTEQSL